MGKSNTLMAGMASHPTGLTVQKSFCTWGRKACLWERFSWFQLEQCL